MKASNVLKFISNPLWFFGGFVSVVLLVFIYQFFPSGDLKPSVTEAAITKQISATVVNRGIVEAYIDSVYGWRVGTARSVSQTASFPGDVDPTYLLWVGASIRDAQRFGDSLNATVKIVETPEK